MVIRILQGIWTTQTFTPLERPARYAGREFLTDEEAAELTQLLTQPGVDPLATGDLSARATNSDASASLRPIRRTTTTPSGLPRLRRKRCRAGERRSSPTRPMAGSLP